MTATLQLTSPPEMGPGGRHLVLDCPHGTTYLDQLVPPSGSRVILGERAMIALAVDKHAAEEHCGCARDLIGMTPAGLTRAQLSRLALVVMVLSAADDQDPWADTPEPP